MTTLALWLLPVAAVACWRWSRLVAVALALAFGAWLLYRHAWQWEGLRWVSAVTGLAGAHVVASRMAVRHVLHQSPMTAMRMAQDEGMSPLEGLHAIALAADDFAFGRTDAIGLLLVGSAAADAAALLWWRGTGEWGPLPFFQVVVLLTMIAASLWQRRST